MELPFRWDRSFSSNALRRIPDGGLSHGQQVRPFRTSRVYGPAIRDAPKVPAKPDATISFRGGTCQTMNCRLALFPAAEHCLPTEWRAGIGSIRHGVPILWHAGRYNVRSLQPHRSSRNCSNSCCRLPEFRRK